MWSNMFSHNKYFNSRMNLKLKLALLCFVSSLQLGAAVSNGNGDGQSVDDAGSISTQRPASNVYNDHEKLFSYFKQSYDTRLHGRLQVEVDDVTTSSINVKWTLPETMYRDSILESNVICETSNGFMLSKTHVTSEATYRLENLHANTSYIVCVYMLEKSKSSNVTILHYSCDQSKTEPRIHIPSLRADSIIAVIVTFGYISIMIIIGYATWRWKTKKQMEDEAKEKLAIEEEEGYEDGMVNGGLGDSNGGGSYYGDNGDGGSRKERSSMRGSGHALNNSDRVRGGSKGNGIETVTFSDSDVVLEKNNSKRSGSAEEVNGCLDFKRSSRGSATKLSELSEAGNNHERKRPKSQALEDSPVKVTEITF